MEFFLPIQSQNSRSILKDRSRSLELFTKGDTCIKAKFHRTDLVVCSHFREGRTLSYSQINTIISAQCLSFYLIFDFQHGLEVLCNNDEKTLGFQLELYSRYIDSVKVGR